MGQVVVEAHAFNFSTEEARGRSLEIKASLVYGGSSRKAKATQRNSVLEQKGGSVGYQKGMHANTVPIDY